MKKQWPSNSSNLSLKLPSMKISTIHWAIIRQLKSSHSCYKCPTLSVHKECEFATATSSEYDSNSLHPAAQKLLFLVINLPFKLLTKTASIL